MKNAFRPAEAIHTSITVVSRVIARTDRRRRTKDNACAYAYIYIFIYNMHVRQGKGSADSRESEIKRD